MRDAEAFREHLGVERWSVLGQSFGGFCSLHYLSAAPDSLREVFFTGGLPPVGRPVDDIYADHLRRPCDGSTSATTGSSRATANGWHGCSTCCDAGEVLSPDGDAGQPPAGAHDRQPARHGRRRRGAPLPARARPRVPRRSGTTSPAMLPFDGRNPLYAVIHESSYADGVATRWSSERVQPDDFRGDSQLLTGEHLFPWHFEDCADLRPYAEVAVVLAEHEWPRLYDADVLASVDVPCAAAIYADDPFVDRDVLRADRRPAAGHAAVAHRRVPPQRPAQRRRRFHVTLGNDDTCRPPCSFVSGGPLQLMRDHHVIIHADFERVVGGITIVTLEENMARPSALVCTSSAIVKNATPSNSMSNWLQVVTQ